MSTTRHSPERPEQSRAESARPWFAWALAALALGTATVLWPEILGPLLTYDGTIDSARAAFFLRIASGVGVLAAATCIALGREGASPALFAAALRRRVAVLGAAALCLGATGYAAFHTYGYVVSRVDLPAAVSPDHPLAGVIGALPSQEKRLDALAAYFMARAPNVRVEPSQAWLSDPELTRQSVQLREAGQLGAPVGSKLVWRPGAPLDWSALRGTSIEFSLHRRDFASDLLIATRFAPSPAQLNWAAALVEEWRRGNPFWPDWNAFAWNDDTTSNRIQMDMLLMELRRAAHLTTRDEEIAFLSSLIQHAERLCDESRFNGETNHGLMQIDALLEIAARYPEFDKGGRWWSLAKERLRGFVARSVALDGVALELSPGYHEFITVKLFRIYALLLERQDPLAAELGRRVRDMFTVLVELMLPNGHLPIIGDTGDERVQLRGAPWALLPEMPAARVLSAEGKLELPPNQPGQFFSPLAGYFVLRAPNPEWTTAQAFVASLMLGPLTRAHFHPDKLSLTLFAKGRAIFDGPGYPSFFDSDRESTLGTLNHGTVAVDGGSQRPGRVDLGFLVPAAADPARSHAAIQGISRLYEGVLHRRTLLYGVDPGKLLIIDELESSQTHTYAQGFRLAKGLAALIQPGSSDVAVAASEAPQGRLCRVSTRLGEAANSPAVSFERAMLRFQTTGRSSVFVSEIDCSAEPSAQPNWQLSADRIVWQGQKGRWTITRPINSEKALNWAPVD